MGQKNKMRPEAWQEAKKRCRLSAKEIEMAKKLGMTPKSLMKNIPGPSQQWKLPVKEWIRSLYFEKFGWDEDDEKDFLSEEPSFYIQGSEFAD